ncbi:MAG: hypothetical protein ACOH2T_27305 [Pseudomonas sp.]
MDTLSRVEIEAALAIRLPSYKVECSIHSDGTLSAVLTGPDSDHFAITGIVRSNYRGAYSIARLAREMLEEMVLSRQGIKSARLQSMSDLEFSTYQQTANGGQE